MRRFCQKEEVGRECDDGDGRLLMRSAGRRERGVSVCRINDEWGCVEMPQYVCS